MTLKPVAPQNPAYSAWLKTVDGTDCRNDYFNFQIIATHTGIKGTDAAARPPVQPRGAAGSFSWLSDPTLAWLHPYLLRMVIAHAKDTYRAGNLSAAQSVLQDYSTLLDQFTAFPSDFALDFQQDQDDMQGLLHRIASNLDYFGNTAGWVPLLSLEATMSAFSAEVDAAVPLLFLSQWLQAKANQNQKDITALQDAMNKLADEANTAASNVNAADQALPNLQSQAAQIDTDLQTVNTELQQREAQLLQEAQQHIEDQRKVPEWKEALRIIGTVAQTVPVYQPALGVIGAGLNYVSNLDTSQPLQSLLNPPPNTPAPDISSLFKSDTWKTSEQNYKDFVKSVDFRSFSNASSFAKELSSAYKEHAALIKQTIQQLQGTQISDADIKAEFDRIKAQDSVFNDLTQQVANLTTEKEVFAQDVANTMQSISSNSTTIEKDLASVASMSQNVNSTVAQFDHGMLGYVVDMERRARERLLRYQYYMAKAYEYRMLMPYPGNLNIDSVVNKILDVMSTDGYQGLTSSADLAAIKAVYMDSVRTVISSALTQLQTQLPERSLPFYFTLTSAQLAQLIRRALSP